MIKRREMWGKIQLNTHVGHNRKFKSFPDWFRENNIA